MSTPLAMEMSRLRGGRGRPACLPDSGSCRCPILLSATSAVIARHAGRDAPPTGAMPPGRLGRVGFGTLFAPQTIARREGKECLGWLPTPTRRSEGPHTERFTSSWQSILFLLACIRNPRCTKACQSPQPRSLSRLRAGFLHSLRLPMPLVWLWWHRLSSLCSTRAETARGARAGAPGPQNQGTPRTSCARHQPLLESL